MRQPSSHIGVLAAVSVLAACAGANESAVRNDLRRARQEHSFAESTLPARNERPEPSVGGAANLSGYLRLALENNPGIIASFERWQASVHRISRTRRLPEPTITFGYFVRSVETRVGPQRARVSLRQAFPWPTQLTAGADAASTRARATQRRFEARALSVAQRVATAYWNLWQIRTTRSIHRDHLTIVHGLSESVQARIATGAATLADLQQIDLTAARIEDNIRAMDEAERGAEAHLRAAMGAAPDFAVPTPDEPHRAVVPPDSPRDLRLSARTHPMIESLGLLSEASESSARAENAARLPSFTLGADWIITTDTEMPGVQDSGKDAVVVGAGLKVPLWQGSYSDSVEAARADARAHRADQRALIDRAESELTATLADLRDATRRVDLYRVTLVPQAESAYESVLGSYTVGRGTVAQTLLSQRDLLELRIELERARADHARTWARLEELVGHELQPADPPDGPSGDSP